MQVDAFLELNPGSNQVAGETTDSIIAQSIEISEFETGRGGHKADADLDAVLKTASYSAHHSPFLFQIKKSVDMATPHLFDAYCATYAGWVVPDVNLFDSAQVSFRKAGGAAGETAAKAGTVYLKMVFEKALLVSYTLGNAANGVPTETLYFAFTTCKMEYQPQTVEGETKPPPEMKGWDFAYNKPT